MSSILQRLFKSKVIINSFWIIGEQMFQMLVSFVIGIISARYLGPSNYGALNYTASFVTFFTSVAALGMEGVIIKRMIANPEKEGEYLGSCMGLRLVSGIISSIAATLIVYFLNIGDTLKLTLVILQSLQLIFTSVHILDSWFQRYLNSKYVSIAKIIGCCVVSSYKIYLLVTAKDIRWFAFSNSLLSLVIAAILLVIFIKKSKLTLRFNYSTGLDILRDSYHFILAGLAVAVYGQMDRIMLGSMMSDTSVGYYTTASVLCSCWTFIPNAIINSFRPIIMEIKESCCADVFIYRLEQVYSLIIWICIGASSFICILGRLIVSILYGEAYLGAVAPLQILSWSETFALIGSARAIWILSENKNRYVKYYLGMGAVLNMIANVVMIPILGCVGAAIATLLTQVFTSLISPLFFKETRIHTCYVLNAFLLRWYFKKMKKR